MFLLSTMPVGGAETLLANMVRRFDRNRINPLIACLKHRDELGEILSPEFPVYDRLIHHKYDLRVINRLRSLYRLQQVDAVVTVGAGDKMFWGRIAAKLQRVPVILSALHSTGWPDGVGRLNRLLTRITDGFIAVAQQHAEFQVNQEKFPIPKVFLIPNGIDTDRFQFDPIKRDRWRSQLSILPTTPVICIVAALRPEKNHKLFLNVAKIVNAKIPQAQFVIAGDGPLRQQLQAHANDLGIAGQTHFLGCVTDVVGVLSMADLFALTSDNEASPVSIMEALSCQRPVVAPQVGSIHETVIDGKNGFLVPVGDENAAAKHWIELLTNRKLADRMGQHGRDLVVQNCSLQSMTDGYTELVETIYYQKKSTAAQGNRKSMQAQKYPDLSPRATVTCAQSFTPHG
jgi:glycosyltransferase involved in cell wall biosynthesis